ncbi:hypothetical protein R3W88_024524 [Solanum pinnatisectum]|uniref:DUF4283 domain-containing protein n=1 Tax=Solanum pinnatisectum TaxID=50273 RepID=A0AAV9M0W2_9SOLN|nr:hypothetical protein R3W88_024524 [Solanum pinnatisectum]
MYSPWEFSVIIKLIGKKMQHHLLKTRLKSIWKTTLDFPLIDLGYYFYVAKLPNKEQLNYVLEKGPWFVNSHFLSVRKWVQNFIANKATTTNTTTWIRLPHLPTKFYDEVILKKIGNVIGKLLKIDVCTSTTIRGRYARICQSYGRIGHSSIQYNFTSQDQTSMPNPSAPPVRKEEWNTITFPKKGNQSKFNKDKSNTAYQSTQISNNISKKSSGNESDSITNQNFLVQMITKGMRLEMDSYTNQVWLNNLLNPLAPVMALTTFHHMQQM